MKFHVATILLAALCVSQALAQIKLDGVPFNDAIDNSTGSNRPGNRIIGGSQARDGLIPYQAALQIIIDSSKPMTCGGTLIAKNWILTAAHCVPFRETTHIFVRLGSIYYNSSGQVLRGSYFSVHPKYNKPYELNNDIALIELASDATINSNVQTIRIADSSLPIGTVRASGWGKTTVNNDQISPVLKYADLQIMDNDECARKSGDGLVTSNTLCTYNIGSNICHGDSGGPLVDIKTRQLVGISSFVGTNGCSKGSPGGYTKVAKYRSWIQSVTGLYI